MYLKHILPMLACVLASHITLAQYKISGRVKEKNSSEALTGVSIYVADLKIGTSTDLGGNYQISNLKKGIYLLDISYVGYTSIVQPIYLTTDTVIDFVLSPAINELNQVIVTGVTRSTELKQSPVIVKTLDRMTWNQSSATNLIDGLKIVPGVNQITSGAAISKPVIRGLGYNRVITLNNGLRQEGQQWGDEHGIEIDEYAVDRIEIVKGPGSLMYGPDGIAGVLNFLAPKVPSVGEVRTQFVSNYQTNNNLMGNTLSNAGNKNGFMWLGRFSNKLAGNYRNAYDGKVLNSGFREIDGSLFLGMNKSWGHSHLTISNWNNVLNLPEGERDALGRFTYVNANDEVITANKNDYKGFKTGFPHQKVNHISVSSNNYFLLDKGNIHADLGFQQNKRMEFGDPANPMQAELFFDLITFNYNIRYNLEKKKGWETAVGIGGMEQSNTNKGLAFLIPDYNLFDAGAFLYTQKSINFITIAGGIRYDHRILNAGGLFLDSLEHPLQIADEYSAIKFNPLNKNYQGVSGSLGISFQMNKISTLKCNISRGYRAPNMAETVSNGRHEGTFRYEIGNPDLKTEYSHQIDLAYFLNSGHVTFEISPFVNFIGNYIYAEKLKGANNSDSIADPEEPAPAFKYTSGNAYLYGGEIYLDIHPHQLDWLHLENSFSLVHATQKNQPDSLKYLPFIPAPKYRGEIKGQIKKTGGVFSNAYVKFGVDYFFKQNRYFKAFNTETETPAYTLISTGVGSDIKAFNRKDFFSLYISAENLTNIAYQNHLSRLKYAPENISTGRSGIYNPGRNLSIKLIVNLKNV